MRIVSVNDSEKKVSCVWFTEIFYESIFHESELVTLNEWRSISKTEGRRESLRKILEN